MKKIGIYQDGEEIQVAKLSKKNFALISFSQSENVQPLYKSFLSKKNLVIGMQTSDVMVHSIDFPTDRAKAIQKGMTFQAKLSTHLNEKSSIQIPIYQKKKKSAFLYSTTMGKILKTTNTYNQMQIQPKYMGCVPNALARFFKVYVKGYESGFVFHFGKKSITCVHIQNHIPIQFHMIDKGVENFILENEIDLEILDEKKADPLTNELFSLKKEISHIFLSFLGKTPGEKIPILLTGHIEHLQNIEKFFFSDFQENILSFVDISLKIPKTHAVPIGLALDALIKDEYSLQFFQKRAVPEKQARNYGIKVFLLLGFSVMLNLLFFSFKNKKLQEYQTYLNNRFQKIVDVDQTYLGRNISFSENFDEKVNEFDDLLLKESRDFPFFLKTANVSQVLQWLYSYPLNDKFELKHFRYQLESYPIIGNLNTPYLTKVTMELSFNTKKDEENFYDAFTKDPFIDHEKKCHWEKKDEKIQTSFYLK